MKKKSASSLLTFVATMGLMLMALGYQTSVHAAASIHFSKHRFIFDDGLRKDSLQLTNSGLDSARCRMSTANFLMTEKGPGKAAKPTDKTPYSAAKILRFSPRQVTIGPGNNQTVRIASRRKPNIKDGEYLSYLKIDCEEIPNANMTNDPGFTVKPKFKYYVPLQVRVGKLTATTNFNNVQLINSNGGYTVKFEQIRIGGRSIIGDIQIREIKSGNILGSVSNTVIYVPFEKKEYAINLTQRPNGPLELLFNEDILTRGELNARLEFN